MSDTEDDSVQKKQSEINNVSTLFLRFQFLNGFINYSSHEVDTFYDC